MVNWTYWSGTACVAVVRRRDTPQSTKRKIRPFTWSDDYNRLLDHLASHHRRKVAAFMNSPSPFLRLFQ